MIWFWVGFIALVILFLALDLGIFHRKAHVVSMKEALVWSAVWIVTSLLFSVFLYFSYENHWLGIGLDPATNQPISSGAKAMTEYLTGYVVEWSLSVDNIFVIALIFGYFKIPALYQHRVLFWGILGAIVMRGIFILAGTTIISRFEWVIYIFGAFLIFTAFKMLFSDSEADPSQSKILKLVHKYLPVSSNMDGEKFITKNVEEKHAHIGWALTPLAVTLIIVEATDVIFAVDSIPAIFGITRDPLLVFTSNIFAILGLRSMYFALAGLLDKFHLLKISLSIILLLVGVKMVTHHWLKKIEFFEHYLSFITLGMIILLLAGGVVASLAFPKKAHAQP
jgi:tellurite resistance protein TerC